MKHKRLIFSLVFVILLATSMAVIAGAFPSFGGSSNNTITYVVTLDRGNFNSATIFMSGDLTPICRNNGGNEAPGQYGSVHMEDYDDDDTLERVKGQRIFVFETRGYPVVDSNGNIVKESAEDFDFPAWDVAGCPNPNWEVWRVVGTIYGTLQLDANGRIESFRTECDYDSSVVGEMECRVFDA